MRHCCIPSGCSCGPDLAWRASKPQGSWCAQTADACGCTHGTGPCPAPAKPICHPARCALGMPASPSAAVPAVEGSPLLPSRCWCSESASQLRHLCLQALSSTVSAEMHFLVSCLGLLVAWVSLLPVCLCLGYQMCSSACKFTCDGESKALPPTAAVQGACSARNRAYMHSSPV